MECTTVPPLQKRRTYKKYINDCKWRSDITHAERRHGFGLKWQWQRWYQISYSLIGCSCSTWPHTSTSGDALFKKNWSKVCPQQWPRLRACFPGLSGVQPKQNLSTFQNIPNIHQPKASNHSWSLNHIKSIIHPYSPNSIPFSYPLLGSQVRPRRPQEVLLVFKD